MIKLGFAINNLGPSQLSYYLIKELNSLLKKRGDLDIIVFYENIARPYIKPEFALMQMAEAWSYGGTVIATDIAIAEKLLTFPAPTRKAFYIWDLEWLRKPRMFRELQPTYGHLELIARSNDHKEAIEGAWNRKVIGVVEDFRGWECVGV